MKRIYTLYLLCFACFLFISCGTKKNTTDAMVTESPLIEPIFTNELTISPEPAIEQDHFVGEYNEPDSDLPNLQIEKKKMVLIMWKLDILGHIMYRLAKVGL